MDGAGHGWRSVLFEQVLDQHDGHDCPRAALRALVPAPEHPAYEYETSLPEGPASLRALGEPSSTSETLQQRWPERIVSTLEEP